jgi:hypothetical protein
MPIERDNDEDRLERSRTLVQKSAEQLDDKPVACTRALER